MRLLPKSEGHTRMISAFVSRPFGLGLHCTLSQLDKINKSRQHQHYISKDSAKAVYGCTRKKPFTSTYLLIQYFDVGINEDGYWRFDHIALKCEDIYDVLCVVYPKYDFVICMDHSSRHTKHSEDSLNALSMNVNWGDRSLTCTRQQCTNWDLIIHLCRLEIHNTWYSNIETRDRTIWMIHPNLNKQRKQESV